MQLKGNIYFHSWWHYLRDSRCQIVQCLLEASSKFGNWNWLNPLSHFCNFITPYGHSRSLWQSPGSSSAVSQNIETEVKHIEEITVSDKDILGKAAKSLRNADCSLNQSIFVNKMLSSFGCMLKPSLTRAQGGCWGEAKLDPEFLVTPPEVTHQGCWQPGRGAQWQKPAWPVLAALAFSIPVTASREITHVLRLKEIDLLIVEPCSWN